MYSARLPEINGAALKTAREERGLERSQLATQCCLSSKMIAELEDDGMASFYNFQLKVAAAKRVGTYLGLSPQDYLLEPVAIVEKVDSPSLEENRISQEAETPVSINEFQSIVNEGEQLDDLIYESTNSGSSLPPVSERSQRAKWVSLSIFAMMGIFVIYGAENWLHVSTRAQDYFAQKGAIKSNASEPSKEFVQQNLEPSPENVSAPGKTEAKVEAVAAVVTPTPNQCTQVRDDGILIYKSPNPSKAGDAVNIKTLVKQSMCVTDSQGKQMSVDLEPNMAHSFRGAAPFVVVAQDLDNVEMFYQGWRVRPPNTGLKQIKLVEVVMQ